jgi:hypothetical protein
MNACNTYQDAAVATDAAGFVVEDGDAALED